MNVSQFRSLENVDYVPSLDELEMSDPPNCFTDFTIYFTIRGFEQFL